MNDNKHDGSPVDASLRLRLRGLRQELEPAADLWPGIAARIAQAPLTKAREPARRFVALALAASMVLAVGVAWRMQAPASAPGTQARPVGTSLVASEADAMTREYEAALHEVQVTTPAATDAGTQPALHELDRSASEIRTALQHDPEAGFLLDRLRHTYALRLEITRRLALG